VGGQMIKLRDAIQIAVSVDPIDARKSIDGLCTVITEHFSAHFQCRSLFIFFNKSRDKVKIIWGMSMGLFYIISILRKDDLFYQKT
jgi:transposase